MRTTHKLAMAATLDWLLERDNPSVRYYALRTLLMKPEDDTEVRDARLSIMDSGVVPRILDRQNPDGSWGVPDRFYVDKYRGTVWQLMLLAELGCDTEDDRVKKACGFILENSQDRQSFGFSMHGSAHNYGGRHSEVIPCLTGNMIWSLVKLGLLNDERVQKGIEWICRYQRADDGIHEPPSGWPYDRSDVCWGKHTCHMGAAKALKALSAIPVDGRAPGVREKAAELAEYFLVHHIYRKSRDLLRASKPGWLKQGFPLMYQTDILELLSVLTELGYQDPRMEDALDVLRERQGPNGRWKLEKSFNGKMIEEIEEKGRDSKWITLKALRVLAAS